ncbi:MAG: hypothetical protein OM95_07905 [Bdellovibrio sp. ArHS]|nr:MAG: hypothetical protein OM95_07905 [Bdellovibrio sp. ArHS]
MVSKNTFITVTGILVLLLFLSSLQVVIYRVPEAKRSSGNNGAISIGVGFPFLVENRDPAESSNQDRIYLVNYKGSPLTSGATLLLMTILQVSAFYYYSRKEIKKCEG